MFSLQAPLGYEPSREGIVARKLFLSGLLLALALPSRVHPQSFSIPVSDNLIELEVSLPANRSAKIEVREGAMASIRDSGRPYSYALIVTLDKITRLPKVTLLEVLDRPEGGQSVQKLDSKKDVVLGEVAAFDTPKGKLGIKIGKISAARFELPALPEPLKQEPSPSNLKKVYGTAADTCSVSCGDIQICAVSVRMACGSCDIRSRQ